MPITLTADRATFAASRKTVLDEAESFLRSAVDEALHGWGDKTWTAPVLGRVRALFLDAYHDESGEDANPHLADDLVKALQKALSLTGKPRAYTSELLVRYLATATVNAATEAAADADPETLELEWVTMHDSHVRPTHAKADGQRRASGDTFHVGDSELRFPGDTAAPIDEWAGCRCVLRPDAPITNALVAADLAYPDSQNGGTMTEPMMPDTPPRVPWHGIAVAEGVASGDRRTFAKGSFTHRTLPLPLGYQKQTQERHGGAVTVGSIQHLERVDGAGEEPNMWRFGGYLMPTAEADELIGLMMEFGRYGVSVDADQATMQPDDNGGATFSAARIAGATAVGIPAFPEAYICLGEAPWLQQPDASTDPNTDADPMDTYTAELVTAGRGPGWVTDPKATERIHAYWTEPGQPGYEKVAWGTPGDFDRCVSEIGEEISESSPEKLRFINAQCAQWHHDALGIWPSTHAKELRADLSEGHSISLVASAVESNWVPPATWFSNPHLPLLTPLTYVEHPEGTQVMGHLGGFNTCHAAFPGVCKTVPYGDDFNSFHLGRVMTDQGLILVGQVTLGGGHADTRLGMRAALAHYDDVSTVVADVCAGYDEHGIWLAGWLRPSVTPQRKFETLAAKLSGDWRDKGGQLSLIAAHCVNVPGFEVVPQVQFENGYQVSLVAAGYFDRESTPTMVQMQQAELDAAGVEEINAREVRRIRAEVLLDEWNGTSLAARAERLVAQFGGSDGL